MLFSIRSNRAATFCLGPALGSATTASSSSLLVLYLHAIAHHNLALSASLPQILPMSPLIQDLGSTDRKVPVLQQQQQQQQQHWHDHKQQRAWHKQKQEMTSAATARVTANAAQFEARTHLFSRCCMHDAKFCRTCASSAGGRG